MQTTEPISSAAMQARTQSATEKLDAWVREVVAWHFDPASGCPFWLEYAKKLGFDPRERVTGFGDLHLFGLFEDEWLRGGPVRRWVPKAFANKPVFVFETGGSTGVPKSRINIGDGKMTYRVALLDPKTDKPTKVGFKFLEDGRKVRIARASGETIDR